jgi:hypothetical protein
MPTADGPTSPPKDAIVLISAMPAAAALPVKKRVGSAQNGPRRATAT